MVPRSRTPQAMRKQEAPHSMTADPGAVGGPQPKPGPGRGAAGGSHSSALARGQGRAEGTVASRAMRSPTCREQGFDT